MKLPISGICCAFHDSLLSKAASIVLKMQFCTDWEPNSMFWNQTHHLCIRQINVIDTAFSCWKVEPATTKWCLGTLELEQCLKVFLLTIFFKSYLGSPTASIETDTWKQRCIDSAPPWTNFWASIDSTQQTNSISLCFLMSQNWGWIIIIICQGYSTVKIKWNTICDVH